jgi:hypothetical protein
MNSIRIVTIGNDAITQTTPTICGRDNPFRNDSPSAKDVPNTATMSIHRLVVIRGNPMAAASRNLLGTSIRGERSSGSFLSQLSASMRKKSGGQAFRISPTWEVQVLEAFGRRNLELSSNLVDRVGGFHLTWQLIQQHVVARFVNDSESEPIKDSKNLQLF